MTINSRAPGHLCAQASNPGRAPGARMSLLVTQLVELGCTHFPLCFCLLRKQLCGRTALSVRVTEGSFGDSTRVMKAASSLSSVNAVDLTLHGRNLYKVAEREVTGEGLATWREPSQAQTWGPSLGSPSGAQLRGSVPGGSVAQCFDVPCYLPAGRAGAHRLASLGLHFHMCNWRWRCCQAHRQDAVGQWA